MQLFRSRAMKNVTADGAKDEVEVKRGEVRVMWKQAGSNEGSVSRPSPL